MKQTSFSPICDTCANEMDQLTLAKDYDTLASYVIQQEEKYAENNALEYAPIFFYIGTSNSWLTIIIIRLHLTNRGFLLSIGRRRCSTSEKQYRFWRVATTLLHFYFPYIPTTPMTFIPVVE